MITPASPEAVRLLHDGALALSAVEAAGMRVDVGYLDRTLSDVQRRIARLENNLRQCDEYKAQQRRFGTRTNLTSREQLAAVLFDDFGHTCKTRTATGRPQLNEAALDRIGTKYARGFVRLEKLNKLHSTYLRGVRREVGDDGYLHPVFNLHTVQTFRSSSDSPNFQNIPARDRMVSEIIRRAFIARDGHQLVEIDISGAEVRVAACYHHDPQMLTYITDPSTDMHRDMSRECYLLPEGEAVPKAVRAAVKGGFVFAEFYGDYHKQVCQNLWNAVQSQGLQTAGGVCLLEHLRQQGITKLGACKHGERPQPGTYEHHIQRVEEAFWKQRFPVYDQWKRDWWEAYQQTAGFTMHTGFRVEGVLRRNEVINYPVQGAAFHCLLWCLVQLERWLRRRRMRSVIVGQIHDSIVADVHSSELDEFLAKAMQVLTVDLPAAWPWVCVPIEADAEVSPPGGTWFDKQEIKL
jgi:DNA polymerase I-like protein with 3'-5' exonuclease and polymerase domains